MNPLRLLACLLLFITHCRAQEKLDAHLEPLRPFLGKTWSGEFKESTPEKPRVDVARWERALNGKAVRVLHSINDGAYGGETIIRWDEDKNELVYHYFSTAGFMTTGTMTIAGGKITAVEKVSGGGRHAEVRSVSELKADGTLATKAEYFDKDGKPVGGREVTYREAPQATVKFK